ncbi:MAG TPA: thioredoxin family protein [Nitrospiria bacterium]|jgi:peroxiredoxin
MAKKRLAIGDQAPAFTLPGVDGKTYSLDSFKDKKIIVVMFTCNHCPYVQAYEPRLVDIQRETRDQGVAFVAINANETLNYPEDDFPKMVKRAKEKNYNFPYLRDETQEVADAYGAHFTPEIFLFDQERRLRYTGRIDDHWQDPKKAQSHDLRNAIEALLAHQDIEVPETHAMGCTIKWAK